MTEIRRIPRFLRGDDPNVANPQRLSSEQEEELDRLEEIRLPSRRLAPEPTQPPSNPLSEEAAALVNQRMIEKAEAWREETMQDYDRRRKAAEEAYRLADSNTQRVVDLTRTMAEQNARHIASINAHQKDLDAIRVKHTSDANQ